MCIFQTQIQNQKLTCITGGQLNIIFKNKSDVSNVLLLWTLGLQTQTKEKKMNLGIQICTFLAEWNVNKKLGFFLLFQFSVLHI